MRAAQKVAFFFFNALRLRRLVTATRLNLGLSPHIRNPAFGVTTPAKAAYVVIVI